MKQPQHRREFVRSLALGGAAAALPLAGRGASAADDPPAQKADKPAPPKPSTEAEARMQVVLARFGDQLDAAARRAVQAEVDSHTRRAEQLREFALDNGDGPFPVFHPYRAPLA